MKKTGSSVSRSGAVYRALKRAIIEQALTPGTKLPEDSIGERLGVSRTLVREALLRLDSEGLVELRPNRGACVAQPSLEDGQDIFAVRGALERLVVQTLAGRLTPEQHRRIITPLEILTRRKPSYPIPEAPDWIPGLFMLFRSSAYREVKGFDERFFMYGEDFDICARTRLAGWKLQIAEDLLTRHDAQRASRSDAKHLYWHITSLLKVWLSTAFWRLRFSRARIRGSSFQ